MTGRGSDRGTGVGSGGGRAPVPRSGLGGEEVGGVVVRVGAEEVPGERPARVGIRCRGAFSERDARERAVLQRVHPDPDGVPELDDVGSVLPVDVADEVPVEKDVLFGSGRGDHQESVERNDGSAQVDRSIGGAGGAVHANERPAVETLSRVAGDLGECKRGVGPHGVVEDLVENGCWEGRAPGTKEGDEHDPHAFRHLRSFPGR